MKQGQINLTALITLKILKGCDFNAGKIYTSIVDFISESEHNNFELPEFDCGSLNYQRVRNNMSRAIENRNQIESEMNKFLIKNNNFKLDNLYLDFPDFVSDEYENFALNILLGNKLRDGSLMFDGETYTVMNDANKKIAEEESNRVDADLKENGGFFKNLHIKCEKVWYDGHWRIKTYSAITEKLGLELIFAEEIYGGRDEIDYMMQANNNYSDKPLGYAFGCGKTLNYSKEEWKFFSEQNKNNVKLDEIMGKHDTKFAYYSCTKDIMKDIVYHHNCHRSLPSDQSKVPESLRMLLESAAE